MKLLIEELQDELPLGWVLLRRTPNTDPNDGFIEMHFTGDVNPIERNASLEKELNARTEELSAASKRAALAENWAADSMEELKVCREKLKDREKQLEKYDTRNRGY